MITHITLSLSTKQYATKANDTPKIKCLKRNNKKHFDDMKTKSVYCIKSLRSFLNYLTANHKKESVFIVEELTKTQKYK